MKLLCWALAVAVLTGEAYGQESGRQRCRPWIMKLDGWFSAAEFSLEYSHRCAGDNAASVWMRFGMREGGEWTDFEFDTAAYPEHRPRLTSALKRMALEGLTDKDSDVLVLVVMPVVQRSRRASSEEERGRLLKEAGALWAGHLLKAVPGPPVR